MSDKLEIMVRNLKELEKREAMYGPGQAPLLLLNQIADLREQIRQVVREELAALQPDDSEQRSRLQCVGELVASVRTGESAVAAAGQEIQPGSKAPFVLQLLQPEGSPPQVQVQRAWAGDTGPQELRLPYSSEELAAVMKALATPAGRPAADRFNPEQVEHLRRLGLVESGFLLQAMYQRVGRRLYETLFSPEIAKVFHADRTRARDEGRSLALRLVFDASAEALAAYPWELLHDDVPLVADGVIDLTRYIAFLGPRSSLAVQLPLRVLGISPRPSGLPSLPAQAEPDAVLEGLRPPVERGALEITWLSPPTRQALVDYMSRQDVHIVHFDGHGNFGRLCPSCHILHTADSKECTRCGYPLSTVAAQGHLAFEDAGGAVNFVSARVFANALARNQTQVVMLSACRSGQVGGDGVFSGVGPALIQAGVPAVVAMQLTVPVDQAVRFARTFYASLANFQSLVEAVGRGRQQLYDDASNPQAWFVPALYLRSDDPRGELFQSIEG